MSLSWDARGRAPLKKQGGQARRARNAERKLLKNKNKIKAEADLLEVAEPIATNRRRESAAHLGACASNKDAFVCMRIARACADRSRGWAEAARRTSRRRQPPLREQVIIKLLFNNMITAQWTSGVIEGKESRDGVSDPRKGSACCHVSVVVGCCRELLLGGEEQRSD